MQQGVRFKKCSEAIARMRAGGYNAEHLGLAADRLIASEFDGSPHDELLMHDVAPVSSNCKAARVALRWSWVDYMLCGLLILAVACMFLLAWKADDKHITDRELFSIGLTVGVAFASVGSMIALDWWRHKN